MTRRAESVVLTPGTCRICGCTERNACHIQVGNAEFVGCYWVDAGKTLCSNPECVAQVPLDELIYLGLEEKVAR
ncbi:MAG TPA: hypothetical protein VFB23_11315 [Candidatus Acidoferrales bacterium]|nr:hypothetical protein [Candidatus Acidoferrales bacterium]